MAEFDRHEDTPKLLGCKTRGVDFHWKIFSRFLNQLPQSAKALDVGCGDLVEAHYLAHLGFDVTGIDLDEDLLEARRARKSWDEGTKLTLKALSVYDIPEDLGPFDLITAFDIIEHLPELDEAIETLFALLKPGGFFFLTVPNRYASSEVYSKWLLRGMSKLGRRPPPGVPHLQFKSPSEWLDSFEDAGFEAKAWEMQIGPLVNTWNLLFQAPVQLGLMLAQQTGLLSRDLRHRLQARRPQAPLPGAFHWVDERLKPLMSGAFTWNLVVLRRPLDES